MDVLQRLVEFTQNVSICYSERLAEAGIEPSVGSKGESDNQRFGRDDQRPIQGRVDPQAGTVEDQGAGGTGHFEWVSWFNHHRLMEPLGYIPPTEDEANDDRQLASQATTVAA